MKIRRFPLEYGWQWFIMSWRKFKKTPFHFMPASVMYFGLLILAYFTPYIGVLLGSFLLPYLLLGQFKICSEHEDGNPKVFLQFLTEKGHRRKYFKLALIKMGFSLPTISLLILSHFKGKGYVLYPLAGIIEVFEYSVFSYAVFLIYDRGLNVNESLTTSLKAIYKNLLTEVMFTAWLISLSIVSTLSFLLGWLYTSSSLFYAPYMKYQLVFAKDSASDPSFNQDNQHNFESGKAANF